MSGKAINSVSSGAASAARPNAVSQGASGGKGVPVTGKNSPRQQASVQALNLDALVRELNSKSRSVAPALRFQVDIESGSSVIQVFDRATGELIRQIPPEKANTLANNPGAIDLQRVDDLV